MAKLILLRHFKSQWNLENRFTGWVDVPVAAEGKEMVAETSAALSGTTIDVVYTSPLIRNITSCLLVMDGAGKPLIFRHLKGKMEKWGHFEELGGSYVSVFVDEALNERHYGRLQGLNKEKTMQKYGKDLVRLWRRSFKEPPPGGESLEDVVKRTTPFFKKYIERDLAAQKNVLVVASHNSLRALIKHIEKIPNDEIVNVEVPYGGLLEYEFDGIYKKTKIN